MNEDLTVEELDLDEERWLPEDETWDAVAIFGGTHDAYFDDFGLFKPGTVTAGIDGNVVPLPAYVVAVEGENVRGATLDVDELRNKVT